MNQAALGHPDASQLTAFVAGRLGDAQSLEIEAHLAHCDVCSALLEAMPEDSLSSLLQPSSTIGDVENTTPWETISQQSTGSGDTGAECVGAATSVLPCADPQIPLELADHPRYRVLELLGVGGMGTVYKAEHRRMERLVALKVINPKFINSPAAVERFRREVKMAARLAHPNIVTAYDADQAGEVHFLVMEFVEGKSLVQVVAELGPVPVPKACDYARQAALGLQQACDRNMVHRDIKPHNLMLTRQGEVKILDFGLARFVSEIAQFESDSNGNPESNAAAESVCSGASTGSGQIVGSVDYIAPEQVRDAHSADIRSDIYSLGCTLYYLLSGQPPFPEGTCIQKLEAQVRDAPRPLAEFRKDIPAGLIHILERMTAKDPAQRFQTPAEVADALAPFATASFRVRPRRRLPIAVVASLLFVILSLAGYQHGLALYCFATDQGELVIQIDDTDVEVVVKENGNIIRIIDTKTKKDVILKTGTYGIELTPEHTEKGLRLETNQFTLKRGGLQIVKAYMKPRVLPEHEGQVAPLARFRFDGDARNEGNGNAHFQLLNTAYNDNALHLNGKYEGDRKPNNGYRAICSTPGLQYAAFTVVVRFKAENFDQHGNIFTGGLRYRWFGMHRSQSGNLQITLNNQEFVRTTNAPLENNKWTVVACGVDLSARTIVAYVNGEKVDDVKLPKDFKLKVAGSDAEDIDKDWSFTNYSNGSVFEGYIDDLIIYNRLLSSEEFSKMTSNTDAK